MLLKEPNPLKLKYSVKITSFIPNILGEFYRRYLIENLHKYNVNHDFLQSSNIKLFINEIYKPFSITLKSLGVKCYCDPFNTTFFLYIQLKEDT